MLEKSMTTDLKKTKNKTTLFVYAYEYILIIPSQYSIPSDDDFCKYYACHVVMNVLTIVISML